MRAAVLVAAASAAAASGTAGAAWERVAALEAEHPQRAAELRSALRDSAQMRGAANVTAKECMEFLIAHMPHADSVSPNISAAFLKDNVDLALKTREEARWGASIPKQIFLNDVLPYAALSEPRGRPDWDWRQQLHDDLFDAISAMPNASAAAEQGANTLAWSISTPALKFVAAPTCQVNSYAPLQTLARGNSSCTGLALFLMASMRSVGLPARVAGVPHWNDCGGEGKTCKQCPLGDYCAAPGDEDASCGNHDWVEVWADGAWHVVDPLGSKQLDSGWFVSRTKLQVPHHGAFLNHSVMATSWAPTSSLDPSLYPDTLVAPYFPMVWSWSTRDVPGWDVTPRYLKL